MFKINLLHSFTLVGRNFAVIHSSFVRVVRLESWYCNDGDVIVQLCKLSCNGVCTPINEVPNVETCSYALHCNLYINIQRKYVILEVWSLAYANPLCSAQIKDVTTIGRSWIVCCLNCDAILLTFKAGKLGISNL